MIVFELVLTAIYMLYNIFLLTDAVIDHRGLKRKGVWWYRGAIAVPGLGLTWGVYLISHFIK